jgi:hypothetical protein
MQSSRKLIGAFVGALLVSLTLLLPAAALAAPITVNLRVEGSEKTLFEGPIAVEAIPNPPGLSTTSSGGAHPCDVANNGSNEGFVPAGPTPIAALAAAAQASGQAFDAKWFESIHDFFISQFGPDVEGGAPEFASWGYAVNYTTANVGGCQFQLAPGAEVLWAYNFFNLPHLLRLTGPSSTNAGTAATFHISDGQTGEPIAGAAIGTLSGGAVTQVPGSGTTDAAGNVSLVLSQTGSAALKATAPKSVRSNAVEVCVHAGEDGTCGAGTPKAGESVKRTLTTAATPSLARILGIASGAVFARGHAPRVLRGAVTVGTGQTLRAVQIRLERRVGKRCFSFSGARARFVATRCGRARFFSVGSSESFSYLLPAPLPHGRYAFDIEAIGGAGGTAHPVTGKSHVLFRVK